jgi:hypothetical protein
MHRLPASVLDVIVLLALLFQPIAAWALLPAGPHAAHPDGAAVRSAGQEIEVHPAPAEKRLRAPVSKSADQPDALPRAISARSSFAKRPRPITTVPAPLRNDPAVLLGPVRGPPSILLAGC